MTRARHTTRSATSYLHFPRGEHLESKVVIRFVRDVAFRRPDGRCKRVASVGPRKACGQRSLREGGNRPGDGPPQSAPRTLNSAVAGRQRPFAAPKAPARGTRASAATRTGDRSTTRPRPRPDPRSRPRASGAPSLRSHVPLGPLPSGPRDPKTLTLEPREHPQRHPV